MQLETQGSVAVGHPVDVASGTLFHEFEDALWPGRMPLVFRRRYSTALLDRADGMFGQGWSSPLEMKLIRDVDGYAMVGEDGETTIAFDLDEHDLRPGEVARNLGAFAELKKEGSALVVTRWQPEVDDVVQYVFQGRQNNGHAHLSSMATPDGHGIDIDRDAQGRVAMIRQRREKRGLQLVYNQQGRVVEVFFHAHADQGGNGSRSRPKPGRPVLQYKYDADGRLCEMIDALKHRSIYHYHSDGRMKREVNPGGMVYTFRFDDQGRCVETAGHDGFGQTRLYFDDEAGVTTATDAAGHTSVFKWNERGQVVQGISPMGAVSATAYDEHGRITARVDAAGGATQFAYDERGDCVAVTSPTGAVRRYEYDDSHRVVCFRDPLNHEWRRSYDARGRILEASLPTGAVWKYQHDEHGDVVSVEDPLGGRRRYVWDEAGNRVAVIDEVGAATEFEFDGEGNAVARISPRGVRVEATYDVLNRVREVRLPDGGSRKYRRNVFGQLVEYVNETGQVTRWRYSSCGLLSEVVKPNGQSVRFEWTQIPGQVRAVINERGERQEYEYNADGRVACVVDFAGKTTRYEYDPAGRTRAIVDPGGRQTTFTHDAVGSVLEASFGEEAKVTYEYDPRGFLVKADNGDCAVEFTLDPMGRVLVERQGGHEIHNEYDLLGRRTKRGTSLGYNVDYGWSSRGQLTHLGWDPYQSVHFEYDSAGHEVVRSSPKGARIVQKYDGRGRRISQDVTSSGGSIIGKIGAMIWSPHRGYEYDRAGNLTRIDEGAWGSTSYEYDPANRIVSAQLNNAVREHFQYDELNNITAYGCESAAGSVSEVRRYEAGSKLLGRGGVECRYDVNGRLTEQVGPESRREYRWNAFGQLAGARVDDGPEWSYRYDPFGRRVAKVGPRGTTTFVWDQDHVVHEVRADGTPEREVVHWEFHPDGFEPIGKVERGMKYLCVNDVSGAPRELVRASGQIVWSSSFYTFGRQRQSRVSDVDCPVRFQGQWHDEETGLHYNRFRYYDPSAGRYISPDPLDVNAGVNPYQYAPNPITWIDPLGLTLVCGDLPPGATVIKKKLPKYIVYEVNGEKRIRFKADEAMTLQHATPGRNYTTDNLAGINDADLPYVVEGRHRSVGVARYGDTVPEDLGGVPKAPGYLDYEFTDEPQSGGVPVKSLTIDRDPKIDVSAAEADKKRQQKYGPGAGSALGPTNLSSNSPTNASPTNVDPSNSPTNASPSNSPTNASPSNSPTNKI